MTLNKVVGAKSIAVVRLSLVIGSAHHVGPDNPMEGVEPRYQGDASRSAVSIARSTENRCGRNMPRYGAGARKRDFEARPRSRHSEGDGERAVLRTRRRPACLRRPGPNSTRTEKVRTFGTMTHHGSGALGAPRPSGSTAAASRPSTARRGAGAHWTPAPRRSSSTRYFDALNSLSEVTLVSYSARPHRHRTGV